MVMLFFFSIIIFAFFLFGGYSFVCGYVEFFCCFFVRLYDFFFFFDPFLFRYCVRLSESIYMFYLDEYLCLSLSYMVDGPGVLYYGIDWIITVESGVIMPWDRNFYIYYYGFVSRDNVDIMIFIFFVSQSVFFFGAIWFIFFFSWIFLLSPVVVIFRLFIDVLSGRVMKLELADELFVWAQEDIDTYASFLRDIDYDSGGFFTRDRLLKWVESELERSRKRLFGFREEKKEEKEEEVNVELQREMLVKFRAYKEMFFGYDLYGERYGFSSILEEYEDDEDTFEVNLCCLPSDFNYKCGDSFFELSYRPFKGDISVDLDRILIRDLLSGFFLFLFRFHFYDFLSNEKEKEQASAELQAAGYDASMLEDPIWLTRVIYRGKFFRITDIVFDVELIFSVLELLFYLLCWSYIVYTCFFFGPLIITFGPRFWIYSWSFGKVFFFFCVGLLFVFIFMFLFVRRFYIFRNLVLVLLRVYSLMYYLVAFFWNYLLFFFLFCFNIVFFRKLLVSRRFRINFCVLCNVAFNVRLSSCSVSFFVYLSNLACWLNSGWMFDYVTWLVSSYNWYNYISLGRCLSVFFYNIDKSGFFFLTRRCFVVAQRIDRLHFFKFYHKDLSVLNFDVVYFLLSFK